MNANRQVEKTLAHQASEWVTILRGTATATELAAFAEWLRTSPRHIRGFLLMTAIEQELHQVDLARKFGAHELAGTAIANISHLHDAQSSPATPSASGAIAHACRQLFAHRVSAWAAALASIAVMTALMVWRPSFLGGWQTYATTTGEQRAFKLDDGSLVYLNTRSRVQVRLSRRARDLRLLEGEALFVVEHDSARPFRVRSGEAIVQAVGTQFNVHRGPDGTTVAVVEGKVRISAAERDETLTGLLTASPRQPQYPLPLAAGEEARITARGEVAKQSTADVTSAVAWRQRRLVFQATALAQIVDEFNRYNRSPRFRLEGRNVELRHYTGLFNADDPESLRQLLLAEPNLVVTRSGDEIVVRER